MTRAIQKNSREDFFIHYDLLKNKHHIPIQQSVVTDQSLVTIVDELNKHLFSWKLDLEIIVYSSEDGWLLKKYWFKAWVVVGVILTPITWNIMDGIVMWLWDGRSITEYVRDGTVDIKELVEWFIRKDNTQLVESWVCIDIFHKAYHSKNILYTEAQKNTDVNWIWFTRSHDFPVQRSDFFDHIIDLQWEDNIEPIIKHHELIVISPINTFEDKKLTWQFKDKQWSERFNAYMKDESFYEFYLAKPFYIHNLVIEMVYYIRINEAWEKYIDKKELTTVYKYNSVVLKDLPDGVILDKAPYSIDEKDLKKVSVTIIDKEIQTLF